MKNILTIILMFNFLLFSGYTAFSQEVCISRLAVVDVVEVSGDSIDVFINKVYNCDTCEEILNLTWNDISFSMNNDTVIRMPFYSDTIYNFELDAFNNCEVMNLVYFTTSDGEINIITGNCSRYTNLEVMATSLGSPLSGPFLPSEVVTFRYTHNFDPSWTNCQWMQGIVPEFNTGWLRDSLKLDSINPGSSWQQYDDFEVLYNEESYFLATYTDSFGVYHICDIDNPNYINGQHVDQGTPLPMGWFYTSPGSGSACTNTGHPNTGWGFPQGCSSITEFYFNFNVQVNDTLDIFECQENHFKELDIKMFAFADGETGCWADTKCEGASPFHIDCDMESPLMPNLETYYSFHVGEEVVFSVEDPDYIIESWNFELDTINILSSSSSDRFSEYFEVLRETNKEVVFRIKNPLSNRELSLVFHFNVVKESNQNYIFKSNIRIDICERFIEELLDISSCDDEAFQFDFSKYLLKDNLMLTYDLNGIALTDKIINFEMLEDINIITYEVLDDTGCLNTGTFNIIKVNEPEVMVQYNELLCDGEQGKVIVLNPDENLVFELVKCDGESLGNETEYIVGVGCYQLNYTTVEGCQFQKNITINADEEYEEFEMIEIQKCFGEQYNLALNFVSGAEFIEFEEEVEVINGQYQFIEPGNYNFKYSHLEGFECYGSSSIDIFDYDEIVQGNTLVISSEENEATGIISVQISGGKEPYHYLWSDGGMTKNRNQLAPGDYSLTIIDANHCSLVIDFVISIATGIDDNAFIKPNLRPNPVSDVLKLNDLDIFMNGLVRVLDLSGKSLYKKEILTENIEINVENLINGVYFIELRKDGIQWRERFVKD